MAQLSEPHSAHFALVRLLTSVDPQVSAEVCVYPEGLVALLTLIGFFSRVLEFVGLESLKDDEPLSTYLACERPLPRVGPLMVVVCGFVEKRPATRFAIVLHPTCVNELVSFQQRGRVKAFSARPTTKRRHIHCCLVLSVDDPALPPLAGTPPQHSATSFVMSQLLVFLQLEVVKEGLAALVTHEGLGGTVKKHVGFQLGVLDEALATHFALEGFLPGVDAHVSLQVLLEGESCSACLA